jgi:hypothetical protein
MVDLPFFSFEKTKISRVGFGHSHIAFGTKKILMKKKVRCCDASSTYFIANVREEIFAHFQAVAVKYHNGMWN